MLKEKKEFIQGMLDSGKVKVDLWSGHAHIMKKDKSGFMKWSENQGYLKTVVGGWNIAVHEIIAVGGGLDVVDKNERLYINHINGNKKDCSFFNLEVLNNSQNNKHAWKLGLKQVTPKRLSAHDVLKVKTLEAIGFQQSEIAEAMGISQTHTSSIITGHRWGSVNLNHYIVNTHQIIGNTIEDFIEQLVFYTKAGESLG